MSTTGHITWVAPERLERNWLPEYFAPRFLQVDEALLAGEFRRVEDIVRLSTASKSPKATPDWLVRRRGNSMRIERPDVPEDDNDTAEFAFWISLPDECLVLHEVSRGANVAAFWSSTVVGGVAATTRRHHVLAPRGSGDIAWLETALSDPLVAAQLDRAALGRFIPQIAAQDLMEVRIPRLTPEEERSASELVRRTLAKRSEVLRLSGEARNRFAHHTGSLPSGLPVLTAATFEERTEQFERLLIKDEVVSSGSGFLCQAAREDHGSDLFVVRGIGAALNDTGSVPDSYLRCDDDEKVNRVWREWYWDAKGGVAYCLFNSLTGGPDLPSHLLTRTIASPSHLRPPVAGGILVPAFAEYRAAVDASRDDDSDLNIGVGQLAGVWERLNPDIPPTAAVLKWLRSVFRPALAVRVLRQGRVACAYLVFGADQLEDPSGAAAHLELLGERLVAVLLQPSQAAEDAARSESLRRLSWMMHQLGGPLLAIDSVVDDMTAYLESNPAVADTLIPDEERARRRARIPGRTLEDQKLKARFAQLKGAVEEIQQLKYQIRQLKNAHGDQAVGVFSLRELLLELRARAQELLPELQVRVVCEPDILVKADREQVRYALAEVVKNACRECMEHLLPSPSLILSGIRRRTRVRISIEDNALPVTVPLLADAFAEDASTYRSQGKGSGLGLVIVEETFRRHGGRCQLTENTTEENLRRRGVTFSADLAVADLEKEYSDD